MSPVAQRPPCEQCGIVCRLYGGQEDVNRCWADGRQFSLGLRLPCDKPSEPGNLGLCTEHREEVVPTPACLVGAGSLYSVVL